MVIVLPQIGLSFRTAPFGKLGCREGFMASNEMPSDFTESLESGRHGTKHWCPYNDAYKRLWVLSQIKLGFCLPSSGRLLS